MRRRDAGITLVEVAAGVTIAGIVIALLVPALTRSARFQRVLECEGHLRTMYGAASKAPAPGPKEIGSPYWTRLTETTPPLLSKETLRCPMVDRSDPAASDYLGPCEDPAKAGAKEPIGCDNEHNHSDDGKEGGNVLLKSGEVVTERKGVWFSAIHHGKCRP
ncbi:MAG TPA: type II secretion system protein [Planctomycetota bacterium]|jgi:hypothetical protein|nr:type II secretion system protein [Planctomycetota bacterium]